MLAEARTATRSKPTSRRSKGSLGVFFVAVGMSVDLTLVAVPVQLIALVVGLVAIKVAILYALGRGWGLKTAGAAPRAS